MKMTDPLSTPITTTSGLSSVVLGDLLAQLRDARGDGLRGDQLRKWAPVCDSRQGRRGHSPNVSPTRATDADHGTMYGMVASGIELDPAIGALLGETTTEIDVARKNRVFCNRNLRMDSIEMIGFDMDYTLALYHQDKLEQLSIELTLGKLIAKHGYPEEIRSLHYDPRWAMRGLMVDRQLGNVFKMDRHALRRAAATTAPRARARRAPAAVPQREDQPRRAIATRGSTRCSRCPRRSCTRRWSTGPTRQTGTVDYGKLFGDIRSAIDEAHRDDSLKSVIKADLPAYIVKDPELARRCTSSARRERSCSCSPTRAWDYTDAVMTYLLDGERKAYPYWRNYFDIVIVGGAKPAFFTEQRPFWRSIRRPTQPIATQRRDQAPVARQGLPGRQHRRVRADDRHQRRAGPLHRRPHLRRHPAAAKKHMWRTAMVLQELEREISRRERLEAQIQRSGSARPPPPQPRVGDRLPDAAAQEDPAPARRRDLRGFAARAARGRAQAGAQPGRHRCASVPR